MASVAPATIPSRGALRQLATDPVVVAWEVTRACGYRCVHCRADAMPRPAPGELNPDEAQALVEGLGGFSGTTLVLTGGDPLLRRDLVPIVRAGRDVGLGVALTPSATPRVTPERLDELAAAGVDRIAISIDGADAAAHDRMRGMPGSFERSLRILGHARAAGLRTQVNTTVTRHSAGHLDRLARLVAGTGAEMWSVFFLVPVGRAPAQDMLDADGHEAALRRLAEISDDVPFRLKVTEAPAYRRVLIQTGRTDRMPPAVNGGRGFMFISHDGLISPSGFLPVIAGSVRRDDPVNVYRTAAVFREVRDTARLKGRCGACEFRSVCGGSRARAYAITGDLMAEDPTCAYQPMGRTPC